MRKWMFPLLLLLTVLLLISFAFLPALAGMLQDVGVEKTVSNRPLHSIVPYISENGSGLLVSDKLKIMQESEISSIVPAMASLDTQQVRAAVEAGIQPYTEAGIMRPFADWEFSATPYVTISWQDASHWFIYWEVHLMDVSDESQQSLTVAVDDETGKFLMLQYFDPYAKEDLSLWDENCPPLRQFSQIWLEQAGLWDSAQPVTVDPESQQIQGLPETRTVVYGLSDGRESPLLIAFSLYGTGEYVMWLKSMPE